MKNKEFLKELYKTLCDIHNEHVFLFLTGKKLALNNKKVLPKTETAFRILSQYFSERGLGEIKINKYNFKKGEFLFKLENSIFKIERKRHSCATAAGILAGFFENSYKSYTGAEETKCICNGDKYCEIKVKVLK